MNPSPRQLIEALAAHPHRDALCTRVAAVVLSAAAQRRAACLNGPEVLDVPTAPLDAEQASTQWGNALQILDQGAQSHEQWALLAAATALYVGATWQQLSLETVCEDLAWLATETPCNVWLYLDAGLGDHAADFWSRVGAKLPTLAERDQLGVVAGLLGAQSGPALELKRRLLERTPNPTIAQLLEAGSPVPGLKAELHPGPKPPWLVVLQALTGWLLLASLWRVASRYLLQARSVAQLDVDGRGLCVTEQRRVLGQELGQRRSWIPLDELTCLTRETRLAGARFYAGTIMLALGSYLGVRLFVEGLRVPSMAPSLVLLGLLLVLFGALADLLLNGVIARATGKTRILVTPKNGRSFTLGPLPVEQADQWLAQLGVLRAFGATLR